jgi:hypothetical protein
LSTLGGPVLGTCRTTLPILSCVAGNVGVHRCRCGLRQDDDCGAHHLGGFSLFVADGKLQHTYSMMGVQVYRQQSDTPLPAGEVTVRLEFHADAPKPATGGDIRLFANGQEIGKGRMDHTVPLRFSGYAGMDIGRDNGGVVDRGYADRPRSRSPEPSRRSPST